MNSTSIENEIFVGREEEIALFKKCFEAILPENQGKEEYKDCPRILSFWGESGVGKTRLAKEFRNIAKNVKLHINIPLISKEVKHNLDDLSYLLSAFIYSIPETSTSIKWWDNDLDEAKNREEIEKVLYDNIFFNTTPSILIFDDCDFANRKTFFWLLRVFYERLTSPVPVKSFLIIIFNKRSQKVLFNNFDKKYFYESQLKPFSFEESKTFLNGFFAQFSDEYLQKIYRYTKGKPEQLQFLVNLVKDKKISAEAVLNELIRNEGKVLSDLKFALEESENLEHKVIAVMTHNLSQKFWALRNDFSSLKHLVEKAGKTQEADDILTRFYQNLDEATGTFQRTYQILENQNIQVAKIKVFDFLNELKVTEAEKNFTIEIITENTDIEADIDKNVMKDAFQNLINNAEKHGFKDDKKRYKIIFSLSEFKKEGIEFIRILYQNNGKPFPTHFSFDDYKRLAGKSSTSRGAGIGGYWIKKVIALHKGEWNAIHLHDKTREFPLELEFILPKKQSNK